MPPEYEKLQKLNTSKPQVFQSLSERVCWRKNSKKKKHNDQQISEKVFNTLRHQEKNIKAALRPHLTPVTTTNQETNFLIHAVIVLIVC